MAIQSQLGFEMSPHAIDKEQPSHQDWGTPKELFNRLNSIYHFTLDVCANKQNAKLPRFYDEATDGLTQPWGPNEVFWCNPPYGNPTPWLERGWLAAKDQGSRGCYLLSASTDTGWFHDLACRGHLAFIKGRLKFEPPKSYKGENPGSNFPSVLVWYDSDIAHNRSKPKIFLLDKIGKPTTSYKEMIQGQLW